MRVGWGAFFGLFSFCLSVCLFLVCLLFVCFLLFFGWGSSFCLVILVGVAFGLTLM